jgi:hypothetical protein
VARERGVIEADGEKVIDRDDEEKLFKDLLQQQARRLFLISDRKKRGKSTLLRKLKYHCDWEQKPRIPCGLVRLDDLPDNHPFCLVEALCNELQAAGVAFPEFEKLREAIKIRVATPFIAAGYGDFRGAQISGGQVAGAMTNVHVPAGTASVVVHAAAPSWDAGLESFARDEAIRTFVRELKETCQETRLVFLIDSVDEQANGNLRKWLLEQFVRVQVLEAADRPQRFLLVLAGRSEQSAFGPFKKNFPDLVQSLEGLGAWSNEHVRAFLELNRPEGAPQWAFQEYEIDFLRQRINEGDALERALLLAELSTRRW